MINLVGSDNPSAGGKMTKIPLITMNLLSSLDASIQIYPTADILSNWTEDEYYVNPVCDCEVSTDLIASDDEVKRTYYIILKNRSNNNVSVSCLKFVKEIYICTNYADIDGDGDLDEIRIKPLRFAHDDADYSIRYGKLYNFINNREPLIYISDVELRQEPGDNPAPLDCAIIKRSGLYLCAYLDSPVIVNANSEKTIQITISPDDINSYSPYVKKMNGWYAFESCRMANVFGKLRYYDDKNIYNNHVYGREDVEEWKDICRYFLGPLDTTGEMFQWNIVDNPEKKNVISMPCPKYEAYVLNSDNTSMSKEILVNGLQYQNENNDNYYIRGYLDENWMYLHEEDPENWPEKFKTIFSIIPYNYTSYLKDQMAIFVTEDLLQNHTKNQPRTLSNFFKQNDCVPGIGNVFSEYITKEAYVRNGYKKFIYFHPDWTPPGLGQKGFNMDLEYYIKNQNNEFVLFNKDEHTCPNPPDSWFGYFDSPESLEYGKWYDYYIKWTITEGVRFVIDLYNENYPNGFNASCLQFMKPDIGCDGKTKVLHFIPYVYYYLPTPIYIPYHERRRITIEVRPESIGVV